MEEWWISSAFSQSLEDNLEFLHRDMGNSTICEDNLNSFSRSSKFNNKTRWPNNSTASSIMMNSGTSSKSKILFNKNNTENITKQCVKRLISTCSPAIRTMTVTSKSSIADIHLEWETDITKTETKTLTVTRKSSISDAFLEWESDI